MGRVFDAADWEPLHAAAGTGGRVLDAGDWEPVNPGAVTAGPSAPEPAPAAAPAPKEVGKGESFFRGLAQGATFGFADELAGAAESLIGPKTYQQARDESRANFKAAQDANPWTYGAGELGGAVGTSLIPGAIAAKGVGAVAKGAGAIAKMGAAGQGALYSGIAGLGGSEAKDIGGQFYDAGKSALLGGATAGLMGKITRGAPERHVQRLVGDITGGATATMRDKVSGKAGSKIGDVVEAITANPAIKAAKGDPTKLLPAVEESLDRVTGKLNEVYARAGDATPGIPVRTVMKTIDSVASSLEKDPGKLPLARAVRAQMDDVWKAWGDKPTVTAQDVRVLAKDIGDVAFRGSPSVAPSAAKATSQDVWKGLKTLIDKNIDEAAAALGDKGGAPELRALNKQASTLMNMREAALYKATREATPSTRARDVIGGGVDTLLAFQSPEAFIAKKALMPLAKVGARFADERLAQLAQAAARGSTAAQLGQRAIELGMAPAVGGAVYTWYQQKMGDGLEAQPVAEAQ